ncbi:hypothetical protein GCM10018779_16270 [Streptomyces griseocarneus]|nr:hypothetical protein GCM10018779_16270 [Streptomyces griseocarneus]
MTVPVGNARFPPAVSSFITAPPLSRPPAPGLQQEQRGADRGGSGGWGREGRRPVPSPPVYPAGGTGGVCSRSSIPRRRNLPSANPLRR